VLIVSGGHTELVLMKDHGKFKWLGGTRDDAAGECFDKSARILGLGYPGGPAVEAAASKIKNQRSKSKSLPDLPRPIINEGNFDFSFSGLKTAVANIAYSPVNCELESTVNQIAFALQESVTDVLVTKTLRAAKKHRVKSILLAGGVAANRRLREKLSLAIAQLSNGAMSFFVPPVSLCTDNAACIASAAYFNYYPLPWQKISPDPGLDIL
jgi:N6-L-threonylcarbamoyladenine synthase